MSAKNEQDWLDQVNWNEDGLLPVVAQDHISGRVLMLAWMNREGPWRSPAQNAARFIGPGQETGCGARVNNRATCNWSGKFGWTATRTRCCCGSISKEELPVTPAGKAAFFLRKTEAGWEEADPVIKDPETIYDK